MIVIRTIQFWTVLFIWQKRAGGGIYRPPDSPDKVLLLPKPIKSPSCFRLQKILKFAKKELIIWNEIRLHLLENRNSWKTKNKKIEKGKL